MKIKIFNREICVCALLATNSLCAKSSAEMRINMKRLLERISEETGKAFAAAGYGPELGRVTVSNRPDLCEFQCNGAMAGAKQYHQAPMEIANAAAARLRDGEVFGEVSVAAPGFLNLRLSPSFLRDYINRMRREPFFGYEREGAAKRILIDYGGPNVAKPLHVGHLRSAVIGESVKRICRYAGHEVIGDIHLGDWGLPMGLIMHELSLRKPELPYFDERFEGDYPEEAPFTISELEEIYPTASAKSKADAEYKEQAMEATHKLQSGVRGYRALWKHILAVSVADLRKNYEALDVSFDLWKGESDVHDRIPGMVEAMKKGGYAYESDGALVVDVKEETDTKEMPPCMILKSDGAALYNTTDLATIQDRMETYAPDSIIYLTDKRQDLYFEQVFRCARKTKLVKPETELVHIGFGTVNGKDGKPFKTREGGVMRLESLIAEIREEMFQKIMAGHAESEEEARRTADIVGLSAIKYGDLSNQASKDYIFDIDRFTSFEGDTGPYILYTIVRIKSILGKYEESGKRAADAMSVNEPQNASEKALMLAAAGFQAMLADAVAELAPNRVCAYIYELSNAFNRFYHETKILSEPDEERQKGMIALLVLTKELLETCIGMLGFCAPDRM